jgi:hypothetical protein
MRPIVRPGLRILRRDAKTVQLGLDWPGVGVLRETRGLRAVLGSIDGFRDASGVVLAATATGVPREECEEALAVLVECGAVVDQARRSLRAVRGQGAISEASLSSLWLLAGPGHDVQSLLRARSEAAVWVDGTGLVADTVRELMGAANVAVSATAAQATIVVVASDSEPDRARADATMRSGLPHVWAYVRELVGVVGPFVLPGQAPCLRCVDAARTDLDPAWPTLLESSAAKPLRVAPCDPLLATLVAAWAAQEVALWTSGIRPQSYGQVIEVPHGCGPVEAAVFEVHPYCGCGWGLGRDTMGA